MKEVDFTQLRSFGRASKPEEFPKMALPHIAIIGRSNVGKSSLLNHLARHKGLARASGSPGKTKAVDFFIVKDKCLIVDLPGYGYSRVASNLKKRWSGLIDAYLQEDKLECLLFLLDARHAPSDKDLAMWAWLNDNDIPYLIVMTKTDKLKKIEIEKSKVQIASSLGLDADQKSDIVLYSVNSGDGRYKLVEALKKKVDFGVIR